MIAMDRVLEKLDEYLHKNDYVSAERHLRYWLAEAGENFHVELPLRNELMGLLRKLGRGAEALAAAEEALSGLEAAGIGGIGAATTWLNAATVYKAFGRAGESLPLFARAREIYERELPPGDMRLAGLYNNMALALVDERHLAEAKELYLRALALTEPENARFPEAAVTHLNLASAAEVEWGLLEGDAVIAEHLDRAEQLLDACEVQDGNYAFVCEKCAPTFHYYGRYVYAEELERRAERIYRA